MQKGVILNAMCNELISIGCLSRRMHLMANETDQRHKKKRTNLYLQNDINHNYALAIFENNRTRAFMAQ